MKMASGARAMAAWSVGEAGSMRWPIGTEKCASGKTTQKCALGSVSEESGAMAT